MRHAPAPLVFLIILIVLEFFSYRGFRNLVSNTIWTNLAYFSTTLITIIGIFFIIKNVSPYYEKPTILINYLIGFSFVFLFTKLIFSVFVIVNDFQNIVKYIVSLSTSNPSFIKERRSFIIQTGIVVAVLPFITFLYGMVKGKYNFQVTKRVLKFPDLPEAFEGFKILQISDIHAGSFDDLSEVERGIALAQAESPDLIVFTGDLVNNYAFEIEPYIEAFSKLSAPFGKFSILGNHDYGDYVQWESRAAKTENLNKLKQHHTTLGFDLLLNSARKIQKGNEAINLVGVENWGLPPFPQHGNLKVAFKDVQENEFSVLLSHDPSHWNAEVINFEKTAQLTLSGHTHGMQFGIDVPWLKWSPVKYKYPQWAGLYKKGNKKLYVNKGFGFIGYPGRVGIYPEITVIELRRG